MKNKGQHSDMKACIVGGNWSNTSNAGPFLMNLNNNRTNSNNNTGGRDCVSKPETTMVDTGNRGVCCPAISEIKKGINFVGYRTWKSVKFVRKHSIYKMKRAIKKLKVESIVSLIGHAKDTGTLAYYKKLLIEFDVLNLLPPRSRICLDM